MTKKIRFKWSASSNVNFHGSKAENVDDWEIDLSDEELLASITNDDETLYRVLEMCGFEWDVEVVDD